MVSHDLSSEWVPDVLVTWNQSDRRSDCEIVKDFGSVLVLDSVLASRELRDIVLQWPANPVVIESRAETVILPAVAKTTGKQRDARITGDRICLLRRIPYSSEYADSAERVSAPELLSCRRRVSLYKQILREITDRSPAIGLEVDWQTLS